MKQRPGTMRAKQGPIERIKVTGASRRSMPIPHRLALGCAWALLVAANPAVRAGSPDLDPPDPNDVFIDGFDSFGPVLHAWIDDGGTTLQCVGDWFVPLPLQRDGAPIAALATIECPSMHRFDGDFIPSLWSITDSATQASHQTATRLPNPIVARLEKVAYVFGESWQADMANSGLELFSGPTAKRQVAGKSESSLIQVDLTGPSPSQTARWVTEREGRLYASDGVPIGPAPLNWTGIFGALTIGDLLATRTDELIGLTYALEGVGNPYAMLGLSALYDFSDRIFRDLRAADLDGDGIDDVVSNVYGLGCTMVGLNRGGSFEFSTPQREDTSCISGNGETVLVADFDEDGDNDVFIPHYQRFDLLLNDGAGHFVDVAEDRGISFPNYQPKPEGATAVDFNRDGHVDIVVASLILLNDGTAHFVQAPTPYPPEGFFDEGLFVGDLDADGLFDLIKHDPSDGPTIFWGTWPLGTFESPPTLLLGSPAQLTASYGLAAGDLKGNGLMDVAIAGGSDFDAAPDDLPGPNLCLQFAPRQFECVRDGWIRGMGFNDLQLISDIDNDSAPELVSRVGGFYLLRSTSAFRRPRYDFRFDLRNQTGLRRQHGRTFQVTCAPDGESLALRHVDGGNGFMAQGTYTVSVGSDRCDRVFLELYTADGMRRFGAFEPGLHEVNVFATS